MSARDEFSDFEAEVSGTSTQTMPRFYGLPELIRAALGIDLKECKYSRAEVAERLTRLTGRTVSAAMVDAYVAETKAHRFPAELIPAWMEVTGSCRVIAAICESMGVTVATQEDRDFAALGRAEVTREKLARKLWERV